MSTKLTAAIARARARDGFARPVGARPAPSHLVTVRPEASELTGIVAYFWSCSCGNACGRQDTDADARAAARSVCGMSVQFTTRAEAPFEIVRAGVQK